VHAPLDVYVEPDARDASRMLATIDRGALGMDRGDYTGTDAAAVALRAKYQDHLERVFRALGSSDAHGEAARVLAFEAMLAGHALTPVQERDLGAQYHPVAVADLGSRYGSFVARFATKVGLPPGGMVSVSVPAWLEAVSGADLPSLRSYLHAHVVRSYAGSLPSALEQEEFDFRERTMRGAREMAPRWRRCLSMVDRDVGEDLGRTFVARFLPDASRARVRSMVDQVVAAFRDDIASVDWLDPAARDAARKKLAKLLIVIGASNRPRRLDGLEARPDDAFGNAWRARALAVQEELAKLARPTDREEFFDSLPQELDGFGTKSMNAMGFTAGFLQPPVFDPTMDDAVLFGGLGGVIGHELSHHFDDEGRKYDEDGNLRDWWSADDVKRFEDHAGCLVEEYGRFHTDDGTPLDGKLTLGENIADNGGLRLAYAASRPADTGPTIDGFTPAQRFFLAWGQIRCENVTPETARRQALTDGHSAGRWRVNGVVSNMPEFARAFACAEGTPMAPAKRCRVW
jgi:predicted metalloendopeptidase